MTSGIKHERSLFMENKHPTHQKGTLAEAKVIADVLEKGYQIAKPLFDYLPFDLIVIDKKWNLYKVQIKYTELKKNCVALELRKYNKIYEYNKLYESDEVDFFALYVKNVDECLYIPFNFIKNYKTRFTIRYEEKNGINKREDFLEIPI
jgi:hypothetical protein